ncbi:hypothetical protein ETU08_11135 [Apibacter muscae]|uniref:Uncharacterized protein n=1 Tax=Apibacter muscae TaxID=2509004 RepID=A0A563D9A8_9FLAO|nr:hypothetical protein [Apibacter muscae]TWP26682.1 hypothetical protein ETU09_08950 [Apibacter muscae]TWP28256.1 hypothetical protein ETU08_11135 [Apibacter muscae]
MKNQTVKSLLVLTLATGLATETFAQKIHQKKSPLRTEVLQKINPISGNVKEWVFNQDFVYDGFYLETNAEKYLVKFPIHLGAELRNSISNNPIVVQGVVKYSPLGEKEIELVSLKTPNKVIYNLPPETPTNVLEKKFVNNSGKIKEVQINEMGDPIGFILEDRTVLRLPKHLSKQLSNLAPQGSTISYTGIEKSKDNGEAYYNNYSVVRCNTITIGEDQYLIK